MPYVYNCNLVRVVDGDTLDVDIDLGFSVRMRERVRLSSVDTSEIFGPNATPEGQEAKAFTSLWCEEAKQLILQSHKYDAREKYGRVLGDLYRVMSDGNPDSVPLGAALRMAGMEKAGEPS